jgi:uncharacterized Rmd1/YagE family protein
VHTRRMNTLLWIIVIVVAVLVVLALARRV